MQVRRSNRRAEAPQGSTNSGAEQGEGELKLEYDGCVVLTDAKDVTAELHTPSLSVKGHDIGVLCKAPLDNTLVVRGQQLLLHLLKMFRFPGAKPVFVPVVRSAASGESDSGDGDIPVDKEIPKVFDDGNLTSVQLLATQVWQYYTRSKESNFSNGPGKLFMQFGPVACPVCA